MLIRLFCAALATAAPLTLMAQSIVFTNGNLTVPLKPNSTVGFDATGNLKAECLLENAHCQGNVPDGDVATVALVRNDNNASLVAGQAIQLTWSSTKADVCRASSSGPGVTLWTGTRSGSGTEKITMPQQGNYTLSFACYGLAGGQSKSLSISVGAGLDPQPAACDALVGDPLYQPAGWKRVDKTWKQAFSAPDGQPSADYPDGVSFPTPIGAEKGSYVTIAFTPAPNESVLLYFD